MQIILTSRQNLKALAAHLLVARKAEAVLFDGCVERLLNHLIYPRQHVGWNRQPDLLRCFQIDHQLTLRWLLDRKVSRFLCLSEFCPHKWRRDGNSQHR